MTNSPLLGSLHNPDNVARADEPRPPEGQESDSTDTRPRRRQRSDAGTSRTAGTRARGTASRNALEAQIASELVMCNGLILIAARMGFAREDDVLNGAEIEAMTDGLVQEAMAYPRVAKWLTMGSKVTPHLALANALIMVTVPRMARRGIIPDILGTAQTTVPMEAGGAPVSSGGYRDGQIDPNRPLAPIPAG